MGRRHVFNQTGFRGSLADRFWRKVIRAGTDECWLWIGSTDRKGYGQIRMPGKGRLRYATHVSLELVGRVIPEGMIALHTCDNPPCVNPAHLVVGTHRENTQDSINKGRASKPPPGRKFEKGAVTLKEYCYRGHPLSEAYVRPDGYRSCRECMKINKAATRARFIAQGLRCDGIPRRYPLFQPDRSHDEGA